MKPALTSLILAVAILVAAPSTASALDAGYLENRVWGQNLARAPRTGLDQDLSPCTHRENRRVSGGLASGSLLAPKGGTYKLRDPGTDQVRRTGRSKDLNKRKGDHRRNPDTKDLEFEVDRRTDSYPAQRGREQRIYDQHPEADLNKRRPISPRNPRRDEYLREGDKL